MSKLIEVSAEELQEIEGGYGLRGGSIRDTVDGWKNAQQRRPPKF